MTSSRRHKSVDYKDEDSSDDGYGDHKSSRPRGYRPRPYRDDSLIKRDAAELEKVDSGWDTDYSPRDKYYLSESDDPHGLYSPRRTSPEKRSRAREHSKERRSPSKHHTTGHGSPSRRSPSPPRTSKSRSHHYQHHDRQGSPSRSHSPTRSERRGDTTSRHKSSSSHAPRSTSTTHAPRSRPKPSRAPSSYHTSSRPRPRRAASSYTASPRGSRPRPVRGLSRNASHTKTRFPKDLSKLMDPETLRELMKDFPWDEAGKVALQAGTVAAMKVGTEQMPWSAKATKIGSAALGAAVVDHVLKPKKKGGMKYNAMRHLAEVAVGNFVVGPAMGKADKGVKSRLGGRGKR